MKAASPETIVTIRAMRAKGHSISEICAAVGHGRSCVHTHCHDVKLPYGPLKRGRQAKVNEVIARRMLSDGATYRQIAARFGCSASAVYKVLNGRH